MIIEKKSIPYFLLFVVYRILLDASYIYYIHPQYDYVGMRLAWNTDFYMLSWLVCVGMFLLIYKNLKKDSFIGLSIYMLAILSFVPTTSILGLYGVETKFFVLMVIYWFLLFGFAYILKPFNIYWPPIKQRKYIEWFWLLLASLTIVYISGRYAGFRLHFDLVDVYGLRMEAREFGMPIWLAYINNAVNTILPILFVLYLAEKKYKLAIFVGFIIFLSFSVAGHKSIIFKLFLAVLAYYFFTWERKRILLKGIIGVIGISALEVLVLKSGTLYSLFIRRVLFVPSQLHVAYYDFFQNHELLYFREGILRWLGFDSPYNMNITFLIGGHAMGNYETNANNGLFSDAYMNLGTLGVFVFPLIIILIIYMLNSASRWMNDRMLFLPVYVTVSTLTSTTFSSSLLNSGLLLLTLFLLSVSRNKPTDYVNC